MCLNTLISKTSLFSQLLIADWLTRFPSHTFHTVPCPVEAYWRFVSIEFNGATLNSFFFQYFKTRRSWDKSCDYVPPTDAQCLWGWMGEWLWLEGLLKDCISFWLTAILYYKKSLTLKLLESHRWFCKYGKLLQPIS